MLSFPKVLPPWVSLSACHLLLRGGQACLPVAFPNGAGEGGRALSPHLLPIERFLPAEPPGRGPGSPNQEHLGEAALSRERRGGATVWESFGEQEGSLEGPCPWLSPILPPAARPALKSDSRWDAEEQMA